MGLFAEFFNESALSATVAPLFNNRVLTRIDETISHSWATNVSPGSGV